MTDFEFREWPKTPRLFRDCVITEKIDGTNAAIIINEDCTDVGAQSRKRLITPDQDNYGFARWVYDNAGVLADTLGPGYHYGEWWGAGIQRRYGLTEKRFSLFNVARWSGPAQGGILDMVDGLGVVPTLYEGVFGELEISFCLDRLRRKGSWAAPGFMNPEGICIFHTQSRQVYKVLLENDEISKTEAAANRADAGEARFAAPAGTRGRMAAGAANACRRSVGDTASG